MKLIHFILPFSLLSCGAQQENDTESLTNSTSEITKPKPIDLALPRVKNTTPAPKGLEIHLTPTDISINGKSIASTPKTEEVLNRNPQANALLLNVIAEELEIQKQTIISEQGRDKFDRRVLLYADEKTSALLIWATLYSAAAVGFDTPSLMVINPSGEPTALAWKKPAKGFLRGVYLEPDGAEAPAAMSDVLSPVESTENKNRTPSYAYSSPEVIEGKPEIKGSLEKDIIRRVIRRALPGIAFCYEQALQLDPDLVGRVKIQFVVGAGGVVTSSQPQAPGVSNTVDQCVARKISQLSFPEPKGVVEVTYPFTFQTPGNEYDEKAQKKPSETTTGETLALSFHSKGIKLMTWPSYTELKSLPLLGGELDLEGAQEQIVSQKEQNKDTEEVILWWRQGTTYQSMILFMDACIQAGFPAISLPPPSGL